MLSDLRIVQRGPEAALVTRLRTVFAHAGSTLGTVAAGRAVGRWRLGRIARIWLQPLLPLRHLLEKLGNLQRLHLDHFMALPQRCRHGRTALFPATTAFINVTVHSQSILSKSSTYKTYFTSSFTSERRYHWLAMWGH